MSIVISATTSDIVVTYNNDKGIPDVEKVTIPATASATQADYVVLTNAYGVKAACWLDINAAGTAPTGAAYVAATVKIKVSIVTGGTAIQNGNIFAAAIDANSWADGSVVISNGDGSVTITQAIGAVVAAAAPHNAGDTTAGSITAAVVTAGSAVKAARVDHYPKNGFNLIEDVRRNQLVFNGYSTDTPLKGRASNAIKFSEVTSPVTASLTALAAQIAAM